MKIDDAALIEASRGPSPPPLDRLRAAAEYVVRRADPAQLVLFGSAARGEFRDDSDFDFLVVRPVGKEPGSGRKFAQWTHPGTGDEIDVIFEDPVKLSGRRRLAGTLHAAIDAEGATIHGTGIPTLRDEGREVSEMAGRGWYRLDKAADMTNRAITRLENADQAVRPARGDWQTGCRNLQECAEKALKAVIIANGRPFAYTHDIAELRAAAEALGERIPGTGDEALLAEISAYGKGGGYDADQGADDPEALFRKFRPTAAAMLEYARDRVPTLLAEHESRAATPATPPREPRR